MRTVPGHPYKAAMPESIAQISFRLTSDELAEQERTVAALRACAGTILAAASVAGSLLATAARNGSVGFLELAATACYALCSISAISVLLPHPFVFAFRGAALLRAATAQSGGREDSDQAYRAADRWVEPRVFANRRRITVLEELVTVSCVLLATEVILWTVAVAG